MRNLDIESIDRRALTEPEKLIRSGERSFARRLNKLTDELYRRRDELKIVLVTGPSASGKTTTAQMICEKLARKGVTAFTVSLDNFYLDRDHVPRRPDGRPDLESVESLDIPLIRECFRKLVRTGEADFPIYDFLEDVRRPETTHVKAGPGQLVVVEGIHALHPLMRTEGDESDFYKVYISPRRPFCKDGREVLSPSGLRLLRRMIRDSARRGNTVQMTLAMWSDVREGEKKYIFPLLGSEDFFLETTHCFEPLLYRDPLLELLSRVPPKDPWRGEADQLTEILEQFVPLSPSLVPSRSLMREFIDL